MFGRLFVVALLGMLGSMAAFGEPAKEPTPELTEREAVRRALEREPIGDLIDGAVGLEEGRGRAASAYPNPEISYAREQTFGALGTAEDYLTIAQTLDLGNRLGLRGEAGETRALAARHDGQALRMTIAAETKRRFYEVIYRRARVAAEQAWAARVEEAFKIVSRRHDRGDAATYDRLRADRERSVAQANLERERVALDRSRSRLQALLGRAATADPVGELLPDSGPSAFSALASSIDDRPDLRAEQLRADAASLEEEAASRWWAPDLRLEGGWKGIDMGSQGRVDGFVVGATLSLPLWDQAGGPAMAALSDARASKGRRQLRRSELYGQLGGARQEAAELRRLAIAAREQIAQSSAELLRTATAGYEGGELDLLPLLDAYRGAADDARRALDLEWAARVAHLEVDELTGGGLP